MKKFMLLCLLLFGMVTFAPSVAFADTTENDDAITTAKGVQVLEKRDNKANITFMKQPLTQESAQKVIIEKNWFCINIITNGKALKIKKDKEQEVK